MKRQCASVLAALLLLAPLGCGSAGSRIPGRHKPYQQGEMVTVTGVVRDAASQPLAGVEVLLHATNKAYDYLRFRKKAPVTKKVGIVTSEDGSFELQWPWDKAFESFVVTMGVTVAKPGGEYFHAFHQEDLSKRMRHGSPVVATVQLEDTSFLEAFLAFRAQVESEAQEQVYREAGKPDKVRRRVLPDHTEVDWWYFELGKVYRFSGEELTEVENFEPITNPSKSENQ